MSLPPATRADDVVDMLHGVAVADPYRWLEDGQSDETQAWVDAQNAYTRSMLDGLPERAAIREALDHLLTTGWVSSPVVRGHRFFYQRRSGRLDQPVLVFRDGVDGQERVVVDPNALSASGIVALDWWYPSHHGRLLAYGVSQGGTELSTLRVLDISLGEHLVADVIPHTRAASLAWLPDDSGFYVTRIPAPGSVPEGEEMYNRHVFFHPLGQDWRQDEEIFGAGRAREDWPTVNLSDSGRWLSVDVSQGWARGEVHLLDRWRPERGFVAVHAGLDSLASTEFAGDRLFVHTNAGAPNYALYEVDPEHVDRLGWRLVLAEREDRVLDGVRAVGGRLAAHEMEQASSRLRLYGLDGTLQRSVEMPSLGTFTGVGGEWSGNQITVGFTSFAQPPLAYVVDAETGQARVLAEGDLPYGFDASRYEVRQDWYTSPDGTRVSIFLVHRRGLTLGDAPTLLTGYGGFNVSRTPTFISGLPLWLDAGGVYALANLRGGGEYGEAWHRAGMLGNKHNVFDDFIAAAEWLVGTGVTRTERLAISGGSNGGLLVGAALTQRPDLFQAVVCQVPLLDMLRYQHSRIARLWVPEYGSAEDADQFIWLMDYSPYHHVRHGETYPATFLLAAEGDTRVDPMHARKMAAQLQGATGSDAPILLRVETGAGHGQGKPRSKQLDEATDVWSFLLWQLGITPTTSR
ncbi:MAG: prolyl oligopeptidase family serine peptidase [Chloroflexota bacterium]